jgi:hypothetical protein
MAVEMESVYYDDGDVVNLPLHRAIDMYGNSRWWLQGLSVSSVPPSTTLTLTINPSSQLQSISHSIPPRSTLLPPSIAKLIASSRTPVTTATSLPTTRNSIAQTSERLDSLDTSTKQTALFLCLRSNSRLTTTPKTELQMSIWIAVSLLNEKRLVQLAQASVESATMAEPVFTIVGHECSAYYVMDTFRAALFWGCALGTKQGARSIFSPLY